MSDFSLKELVDARSKGVEKHYSDWAGHNLYFRIFTWPVEDGKVKVRGELDDRKHRVEKIEFYASSPSNIYINWFHTCSILYDILYEQMRGESNDQ